MYENDDAQPSMQQRISSLLNAGAAPSCPLPTAEPTEGLKELEAELAQAEQQLQTVQQRVDELRRILHARRRG